ncbi:DNA repair protein [Micromonospora sp. CA-259024]|uniref:DNA repair protein n=1 Tax=Micromonospora sp. CA-259024 TaxID=3239965 RepID=UPI003D8FC0EA
MPIQPNDRYHQDPERLWRATEPADRFPAQPRYRGTPATGVSDALSWAELNKLPAGGSAQRVVNTR